MARKPIDQMDDDAPELTDQELASMRPAREVLTAGLYGLLVAAEPKRKPGQRGPGRAPAKVPITIRLDPDVVSKIKASGDGWQRRVNDVLREAVTGRFLPAEPGKAKPEKRRA